jgi:hypothetical protein
VQDIEDAEFKVIETTSAEGKNPVDQQPKIKANRANARASTGPQTAQDRARSARNALRHALSLPVCSNPALSEEVETLARAIAGPDANPQTLDLARRVAEAQIDLRRVRYARHQLLSQTLADPDYCFLATAQKKVAIARRLLGNKDVSAADLAELKSSEPEGPYKLAIILSNEQLLRMDRYERRALSRRKFAIRALDDARHRSSD